MSPAGMAQTANTSDAAQLAPIHVQGKAPESYDIKQSASKKYTAPLVDTPKSVQIIPSEIMKDQAASSLTDVLRNTPGITFGAGEGGNPLGDRPFIRGYDAQASTYVDGLRDIGATSREVFNLEQVEIVKGSDGAYGGRGGAGGSINLISKTAKLDDFINASLGLGTDNYYRGTIDSNWQLSDSTAFRLNGMYHDADVAGRDKVNNSRWGIAPTITFGLNTPTRVTLSYYHLQTDDLPDGGIPYAYPSSKVERDGSYMGITETGPANVDRNNFYGLTSDYRKTTSDMATIAIEHDFSDRLTLRNTSRYTLSDQEYVWTQPDDSQGNVLNGKVWRRMNSRISDVESLANQTEIFGKFETGSWKHSFNIGIELSQERGKKDSLNINREAGNSCNLGIGAASGYNCTSLYNPNPGDPWVNTQNGERAGKYSRSKTTTKSIYAFDTIEFNKHWQAGLGLRLDDYSTKFTNTPQANFAITRRDDTLLNYQLGIVYKPVDNGSIYVSYATSSTPANSMLGEGSDNMSLAPGRNNTGLNAADMSPEKNKTYELGTKWDVLGGNMSLTAAIFRTETTNARVTINSNGDYAMAGKKQVDGIELGIAGAITPKWNVFAGYTYLNAKIKDDGPVGANGGNRFPNTPKHSASLWTTYKALPKLTVGAGAYFVDKQYGNAQNTAYIPSYWRFDAMAGYQFNKSLNMQLNVFNLTDKTYYDKAYSAHYASIAPGRSAILSMNLSY
ncbi:TonB-dependent siderophore receptor [Alcaligenaceae bacterium]|nr:TonB-dependent siderophore receptor [Alcaligenaceae bacterium]